MKYVAIKYQIDTLKVFISSLVQKKKGDFYHEMEQSLILGYFRNRFLPVTEKDERVVRLELE